MLVLSPDLQVKAQTAETESYLSALIPPTATDKRYRRVHTTSALN